MQQGRSRAVNSGEMGVWGMRKTHQARNRAAPEQPLPPCDAPK